MNLYYNLGWFSFRRERNDEKLCRIRQESIRMFKSLAGKADERIKHPCEVHKRVKHTGRRRLSRSCC